MIAPRRIDQTEFGPQGNCHSACLAALLGVSVMEVPNFNTGARDGNDYKKALDDWLAARGWASISIVPWQELPWPPKSGYYIASGISPRGHNHAVIYKDGGLWHDPHPERGGIAKVELVDILYPLNPLQLAGPAFAPGDKRRYRVAATLCACQMTDGFCMPLNAPSCRCWKLADAVLRAVDDVGPLGEQRRPAAEARPG